MSGTNELPAMLKGLFGDADPHVNPEHIVHVMRKYARCMSAGDTAGTVALFAADAIIHDPVESPGRQRDELRQFYQGSFDASGGFIEMTLDGEVRVSGRYGAAAYIARMTLSGTHVMVHTLDVMKFNDDGLIATMHAYWGPNTVGLSDRPPERFL